MNQLQMIIQHNENDIEDSEIYVDGSVGGHPYRFLLDTGAGRSAVNFDDYTSSFDSVGTNNTSGVFAESSVDLITVPAIEIGPIARENFTLTRLGSKDIGQRNLIGMDLLKSCFCHFRFDENYLSIDAREESETNYPWQNLFLDKKFHPYIDVQCGTSTARAVWDTGASITVADINFVRKHQLFFEEAGQSIGTDATGLAMETPMFLMAPTIIGERAFPSHKVAGVDLSHVNATIEVPMDLILGYSTLRHANWVFDFPGKKWAVAK